ncbi:MAG: glycosyltransferase [Pseudomonadota bacterium]
MADASATTQENSASEADTDTLSVLVPITERYDPVEELYYEYKQGLEQLARPYEIIFVIDGDRPDVRSALEVLGHDDPHLKVVELSRAYGEATCLNVGLEHAKGELILTLPGFRQVDVRELPKLLHALTESDMVVACRFPREDGFFNRLQSRIFSSVVNRISGLRLEDAGCTVRLFSKRVIREIDLYGDVHRFIPLLAYRHGFDVTEVRVAQAKADQTPRVYSPGIYLRRVLDLLNIYFLVRFTKKPFRFFGFIGAVLGIVGLAIAGWTVFERLFMGVPLSDRPLFLIGTVLLIFGLQITLVGLIGEIIIFSSAKTKKEYVIDRIYQFGGATDASPSAGDASAGSRATTGQDAQGSKDESPGTAGVDNTATSDPDRSSEQRLAR